MEERKKILFKTDEQWLQFCRLKTLQKAKKGFKLLGLEELVLKPLNIQAPLI